MANTSLLGSYGGIDGSALMFRNRIINGDMRIDQRNAGASVTPTNGQYTLDRWQAVASQTSKYSIIQSSDAPAGFSKSMLITSLSAYTAGASESFRIQQPIEGFNIEDLSWGTASAKPVTISFWAKSSLTGTFGGAIFDSVSTYSFPFSYSISAANTWEYKTVSVIGPTAGTWGTGNSNGFSLMFSFGAGASISATAGSWASGTYVSATGATSLVGTNGATLRITGVQLEAGSVATPFERRPIGTELALCQRYYWRVENKGATADVLLGLAMGSGTNTAFFAMSLPVTMRAVPAIQGSCVVANASASIVDPSTAFAQTVSQTGVAGTVITCTNSSLTANAAYRVLLNSSSAFFAANAEL